MFNEEAIKLMGFETPESAIGEEIFFWGHNYKIIGVLKNFHQESLKEKYDALDIQVYSRHPELFLS